MEELSLGDSDLLISPPIYTPYDSATVVRIMREHNESILASMGVPNEYMTASDNTELTSRGLINHIPNLNGNDYSTATTTWTDMYESVQNYHTVRTYHTYEDELHGDSAYSDYETEPPTIKLTTKEEVFDFIVGVLTGMLYESRGDHLKRIRTKLNNNIKEIEKHFDNCLFICDLRNNKNEDPSKFTHENIVLDFYFTEKIEKVRRTYRFVIGTSEKREASIDVFERPILKNRVSVS